MRVSLLIILPVFLACIAGGCANDGAESSAGLAASEPATTLRGSMLASGLDDNGRTILNRNGMELQQWIVPDESASLASALRQVGAAPLNQPEVDELERNGFRIYRLEVKKLAELKTAMGGLMFDQRAWYGQTFDWRPIQHRAIGATPIALAVDGSVRPVASGAFELMMRSWTIQTEDGPRLTLELVPYHRTHIRRDLSPLAPQPDREGEPLPSLLLTAQLDASYAYVLTSESPSVSWAMEEPGREDTKTDLPESDDVRGGVGSGFFGPDMAAPLTVGEFLLRGDGRAGARGVLVLQPFIPAELFPRPRPDDAEASIEANVRGREADT